MRRTMWRKMGGIALVLVAVGGAAALASVEDTAACLAQCETDLDTCTAEAQIRFLQCIANGVPEGICSLQYDSDLDSCYYAQYACNQSCYPDQPEDPPPPQCDDGRKKEIQQNPPENNLPYGPCDQTL